jgi:hypothetical protein
MPTNPDLAFVGKSPAPFKWKSDPPPGDPKSGLTKIPFPNPAPSRARRWISIAAPGVVTWLSFSKGTGN